MCLKNKLKRCRFISSKDKTTSFWRALLPQKNAYVRRPHFANEKREGGGEGNRAVSPAAGRLNGGARIISEQAAAAGDCGFGPISERC